MSEARVDSCRAALRHDRNFDRQHYRWDASTLGAAGIVATELRAAASEECRRMGEAQRVVRDVSALVQEFRGEHPRLCGCPLCIFWSTARPAKRKAALKALKAADAMIAAARDFTDAIKAAAPDDSAYSRPPECYSTISPFSQPKFFTAKETDAARDRLAGSRAFVNAEFILDDDGDLKVNPEFTARWRRERGLTPPVAKDPKPVTTEPVVPEPIAERMNGTLPEANGCNGHAANGTH